MAQQIVKTEFFYDSLGRVIEDSQTFSGNERNWTHTQFTSYPVTQCEYPDGRKLDNTYDELYRRSLVEENSDGSDIASWQYFGPGRIVETKLKANDGGSPAHELYCTHLNNNRDRSAIQEGQTTPPWGTADSDRLGFDGAGRPIAKRWLLTDLNGTTNAYEDTAPKVGFTTEYDKASDKLYERELHAESRSHLYEPFDADNRPEGGYDSLDRLRQYQRGVLSSTGGPGNDGGGSITTPISLPNTDKSRAYTLDGLGNWQKTAYDPGLVGHWKLNDGSGTEAADSSGFDDDGTINGATWSSDAPPQAPSGSESLDFDGDDDHVSLSVSGRLDLNDNFTLAAWIKRDGTGAIIKRGLATTNNVDQQYILDVRGSDDKLRFMMGDGTSVGTVASDTALPTGQWVHAAGVIESGIRRLYVDGVEQADTNSNVLSSLTSTVQLLGARTTTGGEFDGLISDARIYDRPLSADEVAQLASQPPYESALVEVRQHNGLNQITRIDVGDSKTPFIYDAKSAYRDKVIEHAPAGYWRLGEWDGTTADDQASTPHDGTYTPNSGGAWTGGTLAQSGALDNDVATAADFNGDQRLCQRQRGQPARPDRRLLARRLDPRQRQRRHHQARHWVIRQREPAIRPPRQLQQQALVHHGRRHFECGDRF